MRHHLLVATLLTCLTTVAAAEPPTSRPAEAAPLRVGVLALEGVYNSELVAPIDIFHHTVFHTRPGMTVFTVGRRHGLVTTFEGQRLQVDHDLEDAPPIDVLVVPSAEHNMDSDLEDERLIDWIRRRGRAASAVLSVCDGAFLLAEAGLLDGRRCTTFPGDIDAFRKRYPHLAVVEHVSFVADGPAITGAGGARSYDPAMHLVERLFGPAVARGVGRGMVINWDLRAVRHLVVPDGAAAVRCWMPGDRVDGAVTAEDATGAAVRLADVVAGREDVRAVVLCILAGAEAEPVADRGGLWCEDSFNELANLRYLQLQYADRGVLFVGVLCPPVHHEARFGYEPGAFLEPGADRDRYRRNRRRFVEASRDLVARGVLPFDVVLFDPRFRLLGPPAGDGPAWRGRFKWFDDTQTYGTPTTWVLTPQLVTPGPPFVMNVYESEGRALRYAPRDIARVLDSMLESP
jgi:putative intracellular protease/amidase